MDNKRFAVLIDVENISVKYLDIINDEMSKYGSVTYKRAYADWTSKNNAKWRDQLRDNSIVPIQQFSNTVGKNASDSALIIDAMDILYSERVDGFCIVSSDGDFTRLASRLRESGMEVIGMGESKTPNSFRVSCSVFTDLQAVYENDESEDEHSEAPNNKSGFTALVKIKKDIGAIIADNEAKGRTTELGMIGSRLILKHPDFDVRNYGYSSLSKFMEEIGDYDISHNNNTVFVTTRAESESGVVNYILDVLNACQGSMIDMATLGQRLHKKFPSFSTKNYGYSNLAKFCANIKSIQIIEKGTIKYVKSAGRR
ncbi:MAG: NYN domain-containing protein [Lachnospiraceae bacterium]|nr:NYN domain-containing protein [Lachnospiraceae bacterium]